MNFLLVEEVKNHISSVCDIRVSEHKKDVLICFFFVSNHKLLYLS